MYVITFLAHQNLKAFITHGGLNSITESAHSGVPIIVIPMFGDQLRNARMVEKRGIARIVDKRNITEGSLTEALEEILKNDRSVSALRNFTAVLKCTTIYQFGYELVEGICYLTLLKDF